MNQIDYFGNGSTDFFIGTDGGNYSKPSHDRLKNLIERDSSFYKLMQQLVTGKDVVEIGSGRDPLRCLFRFEPKSYVCVEPSDSRATDLPDFAKYEKTDGITYLKDVSDSSVSIVSSYLFDRGMMSPKYESELIKLISEKTIPEELSFHILRHGVNGLFLPSGFNHIFLESLEKSDEIFERIISKHGTPSYDVYWTAAVFEKLD
ncbi:hypothetical protein HN385_03110 [archaeon]|jgi:hypothetical protein|nr:hypothetical protein [archaeon]MBT3450822.1 hypothetical protein [archaeon]MBT6868469.1 hypothetical protein [archaeon]MBT7193568.1 hypothetical protein [archaeon]MBT7381237.1 hypothetical protein [archaeon]